MTLAATPILCLVTSLERLPRAQQLATIAAAARAGIQVVQVREPGLEGRDLLAFTRDALAAVRGTPARLVVNERCDIALAAGAAGVHLRGDSVAAREIRRIGPAGFLVGRSVHAAPEAVAAVTEGGCDYLVYGTVFPTRSKPAGHAVGGLDGLASACAAVADACDRAGIPRVPVLAIGGITLDRVRAVAAAGASGIAAIELFAAAMAPRELIAAVRRQFDTSSGVV